MSNGYAPDPYQDGADDSFREIPVALPVDPPVAEPVWLSCWRCGKTVPSTQPRCPYCLAGLGYEGQPSRPAARHPASPLLRMIGFFVALLVLNMIFGWMQRFGFSGGEPTRADLKEALDQMLQFDALSTVLVVVACLCLGSLPAVSRPGLGRQFTAWVLAAPVLGLLLLGNFGYHWLIRTLVNAPLVHDQMVAEFGFSFTILLAMCIQPAIVEELFFRYAALGTLRTVTNATGAVLVSAVMFGVAHIHVPLSIPYLTFIGVVLGFVRVWSGSLLLPMLMHFAHNAAIVWIDTLP